MESPSNALSPLSKGLPQNEVEHQRQQYLRWWNEYGPTHEGLAWNKGKQGVRFDALLSFFDPEGKAFLDVGCGFGDLNKAIQFHTKNYRYHGIDVVGEYLREGKSRYRADLITFEETDFLAAEIGEKFDIGIASGIFNLRMENVDQYEYLEASLAKMLAHCAEGVAVDMLSDRVNFQRESCCHFSPSKVLDIALNLSKNVALRHDVQPFEFSIVIYTDDSFHDEMTVFNRHLARSRPLVVSGILS